jgi:transcriptional regulator with XRE-family HTH domain
MERKGLSAAELAHSSGLNYGGIFGYLRGRSLPNLRALCALLNSLEVSWQEFDWREDMGHRRKALEILVARSNRTTPPEVGPEDF